MSDSSSQQEVQSNGLSAAGEEIIEEIIEIEEDSEVVGSSDEEELKNKELIASY